ncbi:MAG: uroporphyrinogen decarboxylase family protein [SAR202 cluster bacterium]|nr:uroporphyrinogen decarboxylase family protein [SAR202 cluster bacterium]
MVDQMTRWDRVRAALSGGDIDRPPVSMWRHFYGQETTARGLADAMMGFQNEYDWDFMKINPRASYHAEDWGLEISFSGTDSRGHETVGWPVNSPEDWGRIERLDPTVGALGEQLEAIEFILADTSGEVPLLMTVFTPLAVAAQMAGSVEAMSRLVQEDQDALLPALDAITETLCAFAGEAMSRGAAGLFFATTQWASYDQLSDDEYANLGRPYDLRVLEAVSDAEFNALHVCGSDNMLSELRDYPVHAYSWDAQDDTNVWLVEGAKLTGKAVIGGLSNKGTIATGTANKVTEEVNWTAEMIEGSGWMLGPSCSLPPETPSENLSAARDAVNGLRPS